MAGTRPVEIRSEDAEQVEFVKWLRQAGGMHDDHFDALCRTASNLFSVPIALVALVDDEEQWFAGRSGMEAPSAVLRGSFCSHVVQEDDVLVVADAMLDPRFRNHPRVASSSGIRFYAGAPIVLGSGVRLGSMCIMDTRPRTFSAEEATQLHDLAEIAVAHLRLQQQRLDSCERAQRHRDAEHLLQVQNRELHERERELREANGLLSLAEQLSLIGHWHIDIRTSMVRSSAGFESIFGREPTTNRFRMEDHFVVLHPDDRTATKAKIESLNAGLVDSYRNRARILLEDGRERVIVSEAVSQRDDDGQVVSVFGVCMDITTFALVEEELRDSTTALADTLDNMDQGLFVVNPQGRLTIINRRGIELADFPVEWLTTKPTHAEILELLERRGELAPPLRSVLASFDEGIHTAGECYVYERTRPNGLVIEGRCLSLAEGSVMITLTDMTARRQAERALSEREAHYRILAEAASDLILRFDLDGTIRYVSPASLELLGYSPDEILSMPSTLEMVHPDDRIDPHRSPFGAQSAQQDAGLAVYRMRHRDGRWVEMEFRSRIIRERDGEATEVISAGRDVTERMAIDRQLRRSEERLSLALEGGSDGIWDWNLKTGEILRSGKFFEKLPEELSEMPDFEGLFSSVISPFDSDQVRSRIAEHLSGATSIFEGEFRTLVGHDGGAWFFARGRIVERSGDGSPLRMAGTVVDITARKQAEARIAHLAEYDGLTDLPNRGRFRDQLGQRLAEVKRHGETLAVLCLDLDRFKTINDTLGHAIGDLVLREIAQRITLVVREEDLVARLGGDEFAVLVREPGARALFRIGSLAERLIEVANDPVTIEGHEIRVGITIGIALAPNDGPEADAVFKRADLALHRAKVDGRNKFRFFEAGMDEALARRRALELDLRSALARGELELHYQPVLDTKSRTFSSFEALVRWRHPERGLVSPADFIPIAEETGLIVSIGEWVIETACREAMFWSDQSLKISVNVSPVQFRTGRLIESVVSALEKSNLPPGRLELEITESVLMGDSSVVLSTIQTIRGMGIRFALDDFGTGFSSLSYLHQFPFDRIKIDRSFVREIHNPRTAAIIRATVDLAHRLGMLVTAEGIETEEQLGLVHAEGCVEIQGFLISRPVSAAEAHTLMRRATRMAA